MDFDTVLYRIFGPLLLGVLVMWLGTTAFAAVFRIPLGALTPSSWFTGFLVGVILAIAIIVVRATLRSRRVAQKAAAEKAEADKRQFVAQAEYDAREIERLQAGIAHWRDVAVSEAKRGIDLFESMPQWLEHAAKTYAKATRAFADGAFSPFWSGIETAYSALESYLERGNEIGEASRSFANAIGRLADWGDSSIAELGPFPVEMDSERVMAQHVELLSKLDELVYEAQKVPTFALIWEQRRTTSAVETGFRNLEDAINRMGNGIDSSISRLEVSLQSSNADVVRSLERLTDTTATGAYKQVLASHEMVHQAKEQASRMKELSAHAEAIRDHLYHPELARWLHG